MYIYQVPGLDPGGKSAMKAKLRNRAGFTGAIVDKVRWKLFLERFSDLR